jgi:hypothetical protein
MNILFFVVNFRADDHLLRLVMSVAAAQAVCPSVCVDLHVLENSQKSTAELAQLRARLGIIGVTTMVHASGTNEGYFGGLGLAQTLVSDRTTCVIYCNPDVLLDADFFVMLQRACLRHAGVVAPAIISIEGGFDQNPKYRQRVSPGKLRRLQRIYSHRLTYISFNALARVKEVTSNFRRRKLQGVGSSTQIYAPHGAVFIFSDIEFFLRLPTYPCFLFGEELFVAEEALLAGVPVLYEPSLRVRDVRHASIDQLDNDYRRSLMHKSVTFILDHYYNRLKETVA